MHEAGGVEITPKYFRLRPRRLGFEPSCLCFSGCARRVGLVPAAARSCRFPASPGALGSGGRRGRPCGVLPVVRALPEDLPQGAGGLPCSSNPGVCRGPWAGPS